MKFEELLVVPADPTEAYWLADEPPHVRRWHRQEREPVGAASR